MKLKQGLLATALLISALPVMAAKLTLINDESQLNFVSIKKDKVAEVHYFKSLKGNINKGKLTLNIDLTSVETNIPIRNQRMQEMLFETSTFTKAVLTSNIDMNKVNKLNVGESTILNQPVTLNLHGQTQPLTSLIKVVALKNNKYLAVSLKPVVINASQFNLVKGIQKLQHVAKLPSIATAVPVSFSLTFEK